MMNWYVKLIIFCAVMGMIVFSAFTVQQQNSNTRASMEVVGALESALLGEARVKGKDGGVDKREMVANLVESVIETQKNHGKDVRLSYIFLNNVGQQTEVDEEIDSVQFKTQIVNKEGKVVSNATKRISLNMIERRTGTNVVGENTRVVNFETSTERNRSKEVTIAGLKNISRVEVNDGNVTYSVNGNSVTLNVSNGVGRLFYTGEGELVKEDKKYIRQWEEENYDKDGYKGKLEKYLLSGEYIEADTKYITNWETEDYDDGSYKGKLELYVSSGEFIEGEWLYVSDQMQAEYDKGGYKGTLTQYLDRVDVIPEQKKEVKDYHSEEYEDKYGYKGKLEKSGEVDGKPVYSGTVIKPEESIPVYRYAGWVKEDDIDTREYRYKGEVKRPAKDTRKYAYSGWVTRQQSDTRETETRYTYEVKIHYTN